MYTIDNVKYWCGGNFFTKAVLKPEQIKPKWSAGAPELRETMFFCVSKRALWNSAVPIEMLMMHFERRHIWGTEPAARTITYHVHRVHSPARSPAWNVQAKIVSWIHKSSFEVIFITFIFSEALAGWEIPSSSINYAILDLPHCSFSKKM